LIDLYFAGGTTFAMFGSATLTRACQLRKERLGRSHRVVDVIKIPIIAVGGALLPSGIYCMAISHYMLGFCFMFGGYIGLTLIRRQRRNEFFTDLFDSKKALLVEDALYFATGAFFTTFGLFLLTVGTLILNGWPVNVLGFH